MNKKIIYIILVMITFVFTSCSTQNSSYNKIKNQDSTRSIQSESSKPIDFSTFTLLGDSFFYCPFIFNGNDLIFPNAYKNNLLSVTSLPIPNDLLNSKDVNTLTSYYSNNIALINNILYFSNDTDNSSLCSFNLENKTFTKLSDNSIQNLINTGSKLYYINKSDNNTIYEYDTTEKLLRRISSDTVGKFIVNGNFIVYENLSDNAKLYSINIDGTERQKLTDYTSDSFIPFDGQLLFFNSSDNNNLYSLAPSTLETKRLYVVNGSQLKTIGNSIYFVNEDSSNHLYSLTLDSASSKVNLKEEINEPTNTYYLTTNGIFYEKSINVNDIYFKSFSKN